MGKMKKNPKKLSYFWLLKKMEQTKRKKNTHTHTHTHIYIT